MACALGIELRFGIPTRLLPTYCALPTGLVTGPAISPSSDLWLPGQLSQEQRGPRFNQVLTNLHWLLLD